MVQTKRVADSQDLLSDAKILRISHFEWMKFVPGGLNVQDGQIVIGVDSDNTGIMGRLDHVKVRHNMAFGVPDKSRA